MPIPVTCLKCSNAVAVHTSLVKLIVYATRLQDSLTATCNVDQSIATEIIGQRLIRWTKGYAGSGIYELTEVLWSVGHIAVFKHLMMQSAYEHTWKLVSSSPVGFTKGIHILDSTPLTISKIFWLLYSTSVNAKACMQTCADIRYDSPNGPLNFGFRLIMRVVREQRVAMGHFLTSRPQQSVRLLCKPFQRTREIGS